LNPEDAVKPEPQVENGGEAAEQQEAAQ